jgi:hypothetical protein
VAHDVRLFTDGAVNRDIATGLAGSTRRVTWIVPDIATGRAVVQVEALDGAGRRTNGRTPQNNVFTITGTGLGDRPPPPTIGGFSPPSGAAGTAVTVSGTNLAGASVVMFNDTPGAVLAASAGAETAVLPAGATTGPITVTTSGGTATSAASFAVTAPPLTAPVAQRVSGRDGARVGPARRIAAGQETLLRGRVAHRARHPGRTLCLQAVREGGAARLDLRPGRHRRAD